MGAYVNILFNEQAINFYTCDLETARNTFNYWISQTETMHRQLSDIGELWPDGIEFMIESIHFKKILLEYLENLARQRELMNKEHTEQNNEFVTQSYLKGKELIKQMNNHFDRANKHMITALGINMNNYFLQNIDNPTINYSFDELTNIMTYIDFIFDIIEPYQNEFNKFSIQHFQSTNSPELLQDPKWKELVESHLLTIKGIAESKIRELKPPVSISIPRKCEHLNSELTVLIAYTDQLSSYYKKYLYNKDAENINGVNITLTDINNQILSITAEADKIGREIKLSASNNI
jgi:hypothetical protein